MLNPNNTHLFEHVNEPMIELTSYESGFIVESASLYEKALKVSNIIKGVILAYEDIEIDIPSSDPFSRIPDAFFTRNEVDFRGCVLATPERAEVQSVYSDVKNAANNLCRVINEDFPKSQDVVYDVYNNLIMFKDDGSISESEKIDNNMEKVVDRYNKIIPRRLSTARARDAISVYISTCQNATAVVKRTLQSLSAELLSDVTSIVQCSHWAVILETASLHVGTARSKGWTLPHLLPDGSEDLKTGTSLPPFHEMHLKELIPYVIHRPIYCHLNFLHTQ